MTWISNYIGEIYLTAFAVVFRVYPGRKLSYKAGVAISVITLTLTLVLFSILAWIDIWVGRQFLISKKCKWIFLGGVILVYFTNFYILLLRGYGIAYERQIDRLDKSKRALLIRGCLVVGVVVLVLFVASAIAHHRVFQIAS